MRELRLSDIVAMVFFIFLCAPLVVSGFDQLLAQYKINH